MSSGEKELMNGPDCFMSANKYASYLWLGHCIFYPEDYRLGLADFGHDEGIMEREMSRFRAQLAAPETSILLPLMSRVIHSAHLELGEGLPRTASERRRLQVYLVGEVSVAGMEIIQQDGFLDRDPALAEIKSPFRDSTLIDKVIRYKRSVNALGSLAQYATMDRLLPGYQQATISE